MLRVKAKQMLDGIDADKIKKASVSSLSLGTDRLLNRAEAIENRGSNLIPFMEMCKEFGFQPSHSASRVTIREIKEVDVGPSQEPRIITQRDPSP